MNDTDLIIRIAELEQENADLKEQLFATALRLSKKPVNPAYAEVIRLLKEQPMTIGEIAEAMRRENRLVSQWLHAIKTRYGANIITLADGKKQLMNGDELNLAE